MSGCSGLRWWREAAPSHLSHFVSVFPFVSSHVHCLPCRCAWCAHDGRDVRSHACLAHSLARSLLRTCCAAPSYSACLSCGSLSPVRSLSFFPVKGRMWRSGEERGGEVTVWSSLAVWVCGCVGVYTGVRVSVSADGCVYQRQGRRRNETTRKCPARKRKSSGCHALLSTTRRGVEGVHLVLFES